MFGKNILFEVPFEFEFWPMSYLIGHGPIMGGVFSSLLRSCHDLFFFIIYIINNFLSTYNLINTNILILLI